MDKDTEDAIRTGIVDSNRYKNDPFYRGNLLFHNPLAKPLRLRELPPEFYASNRRGALRFLWFLVRCALVLAAFGVLIWAVLETTNRLDWRAQEDAVVTATLGLAVLFGLVFAWRRLRHAGALVLEWVATTAQGAGIAAGLMALAILTARGITATTPTDAPADFQAMAIVGGAIVLGTAALVSEARLLTTGVVAGVVGALLGVSWVAMQVA